MVNSLTGTAGSNIELPSYDVTDNSDFYDDEQDYINKTPELRAILESIKKDKKV